MNNFLNFIKKNKHIVFWTAIIFYYFSFSVFIFIDSAHYMNYIHILEGSLPMAQWDIVRGPVFPLLIFLSRKIFGASHFGLLITTFIFFTIMLLIVRNIMNYICDSINNEKIKKIYYYGSLIIIIMNPIILGYYHALLTEFVAITIAVGMCYLSWKWISINFNDNKIRYILYTIFFVFMTIFSWHLKQPYVALAIFPLGISTLISIFENLNLRNILQRVTTLILCFICLFSSIKLWNSFLGSHQLDLNSERNVVQGLGGQILDASKGIKIEREIKDDEEVYVVNILNDDGKILNSNILDQDSDKPISVSVALKEVFASLLSNPNQVLKGYLAQYFILSDLYPVNQDEPLGYENNFGFQFSGENVSIGLAIWNPRDNIYYMPEYLYSNVANYYCYNHPSKILRIGLGKFQKLYQNWFSWNMLILPIGFLIAVLFRFILRNKIDDTIRKEFQLLIIFLGFSLANALLYVLTGACIDRYVAVNQIPMILSCFILIKWSINLVIKNRQNHENI